MNGAALLIADRAERDLLRAQRRGAREARRISQRVTRRVIAALVRGEQPLVQDEIVRGLLDLTRDAMMVTHMLGVKRERELFEAHTITASVFDATLGQLAKRLSINLKTLRGKYGIQALRVLQGVSLTAEHELQQVIGELVKSGSTLSEGRRVLADAFDRLGLTPKNPYQLETIFRTQTQLAYGAGKWEADQAPEIQEILWGYTYTTVGDDRVREAHENLDGMTLPKDDPRWERLWPPNGYNCRCQPIPLFEEREIVEPREGGGADEGFDFNAGRVFGTGVMAAFNPDQPRDEKGRFGSGGGAPAKSSKIKAEQEISRLLLDHSHGGKLQRDADKEIVRNLREHTPLGDAIADHVRQTTNAAVEKEDHALSDDIDKKVQRARSWSDEEGMVRVMGDPDPKRHVMESEYRQILREDAEIRMQLVRKGSLDNPIQSWSRRSSGAVMNTDVGGIGYDHIISSVRDAIAKGYGVLGYAGAPGEGETTLIRLGDIGLSLAFDPDQPRDEKGRFGSGGSSDRGDGESSVAHSSWGERDAVVGSRIKIAGRDVNLEYDREVTSIETVERVQTYIESLPREALKSSAVKRIEIFEDQDEMTRRLDELGIAPDEGNANGAYDFDTHTAYVSTWDGYKHSARTTLHELGHSVVGLDEYSAESWAQAYLGEDDVAAAFDPDQPRDERGRFGSGSSKQPPKTRNERARDAANLSGADVQRYAEGVEPVLAAGIGGESLPDNEPVDVVVRDENGKITHGVELKVMVNNKANKITMRNGVMERKAKWSRANKAPFHTVVFDDSKIFAGTGRERKIYYRRGFGSFRVSSMHEVKGGMSELKTLMGKRARDLPEGAG